MYKKMQEDLIARHAAEKEGSLEAQRVKYEEQLSKLREQLVQSTASSPTPPTHRYTTLVHMYTHLYTTLYTSAKMMPAIL